MDLANDTSVRSRRPIGVIFDVLNVSIYNKQVLQKTLGEG